MSSLNRMVAHLGYLRGWMTRCILRLMPRTTIGLVLFLLVGAEGTPRQLQVQAAPPPSSHPSPGAIQGSHEPNSAEHVCVPFVQKISWKQKPVPEEIRPLIPDSALVRLVIPLSDRDTLTIFEIGLRDERQNSITEPDTRLLITREGRSVYRFAVKDLPGGKGYPRRWAEDEVAMSAANLCSAETNVTYIALQAGNEGGYYVALMPSNEGYKLLSISDSDQGKLVVSKATPLDVEVWSAAEEGMCVACDKRFFVKTLRFGSDGFRLVSRLRTMQRYVPFTDEPLVVKP